MGLCAECCCLAVLLSVISPRVALALHASNVGLDTKEVAEVAAARAEQAQAVAGPDGWLALVALQWVHRNDLSVGSSPRNTLQVTNGAAHAFHLSVVGKSVRLASADATVTLDGRKPSP